MSAPFTRTHFRSAAAIALLLSGLYIAFISQASSPNYRLLWENLLPVAIIHALLCLWYLVRVRHWTRWIVIGGCVIGLFYFIEMTLRVLGRHVA